MVLLEKGIFVLNETEAILSDYTIQRRKQKSFSYRTLFASGSAQIDFTKCIELQFVNKCKSKNS